MQVIIFSFVESHGSKLSEHSLLFCLASVLWHDWFFPCIAASTASIKFMQDMCSRSFMSLEHCLISFKPDIKRVGRRNTLDLYQKLTIRENICTANNPQFLSCKTHQHLILHPTRIFQPQNAHPKVCLSNLCNPAITVCFASNLSRALFLHWSRICFITQFLILSIDWRIKHFVSFWYWCQSHQALRHKCNL